MKLIVLLQLSAPTRAVIISTTWTRGKIGRMLCIRSEFTVPVIRFTVGIVTTIAPFPSWTSLMRAANSVTRGCIAHAGLVVIRVMHYSSVCWVCVCVCMSLWWERVSKWTNDWEMDGGWKGGREREKEREREREGKKEKKCVRMSRWKKIREIRGEKGRVGERKEDKSRWHHCTMPELIFFNCKVHQLLLSSKSLFAWNPLGVSFGLFVKVVIFSRHLLANHLACFQSGLFFFGLFLSFSCYTDEPLLTQHSKNLVTSLNSPGPWSGVVIIAS